MHRGRCIVGWPRNDAAGHLDASPDGAQRARHAFLHFGIDGASGHKTPAGPNRFACAVHVPRLMHDRRISLEPDGSSGARIRRIYAAPARTRRSGTRWMPGSIPGASLEFSQLFSLETKARTASIKDQRYGAAANSVACAGNARLSTASGLAQEDRRSARRPRRNCQPSLASRATTQRSAPRRRSPGRRPLP
jgi:hypothetical protein